MFIAHMPSGYIFSVLLHEKFKSLNASYKSIFTSGMIGGIAPDFDMIYFYLIDNKQTHHHKYITHWPILWIILILLSISWLSFSNKSKKAYLSLIFSLSGLLHIALDSFVVDIWWFAPFIDKSYSLFKVPAVFSPWWLSFLLHWSFAIELFICSYAFYIYFKRLNRSYKKITI